MKKLTKKQQLLQIRRSQYASNLDAKISHKRNKAKQRAQKKRARGRPNKVKLMAPRCFDVKSDILRKPLLDFLHAANQALKLGHTVTMCFDETNELHPCGTLFFRAHLDILLQKYAPRLKATYPEDSVVGQLFQHIGILEILGLTPKYEIVDEKVRHWHYHTGDTVHAATYKPLTRSVISHIKHPEKALFADCLNEAVTNTVQHAYEFDMDDMPPPEQRKWWMFSENKDNYLFVAIYDCGISIPGHLGKRPELREYFQKYYRNKAAIDVRYIDLAVNSDRTSTKMYNRGKGLPEMYEFSKSLPSGALTILSRLGGFSYKAGSETSEMIKFQHKLAGTLVLWRIPFDAGVTNG